MRRGRSHCKGFAIAVVLTAVEACSSSTGQPASLGSDAGRCPGSVRQPLFNGAERESFLGLTDAQIRAIVSIVDGTRPTDGPLCTGTLVAPDWVVTARHCLAIASATVVVRTTEGGAAEHRVLGSVRHLDRDVALLHIDVAPDSGVGGAAPIAVADARDATMAMGDVVEMAGYGLTESNATRALRFLAEPIVDLDSVSVTVDGFGVSGACVGDSGGPLLVRGSDGSVVVLGVSSNGSSTCVDDDTYVRLDGLRDWLLGVVGSDGARDRTCGSLGQAGRCLYGRALWCSGAKLDAESCSAGQTCGWDPAANGFRCMDPSTDRCRGVDSRGACRENEALSCNSGVLLREVCGPCEVCRTDGKTGAPHCVPGP